MSLVKVFIFLSIMSPSLSYPIRKMHSTARTPPPMSVCQTRIRALCTECLSERTFQALHPPSSDPQTFSLKEISFHTACQAAVARNRPHPVLHQLLRVLITRAAEHGAPSLRHCSFLLRVLQRNVICPLPLSPNTTGIFNPSSRSPKTTPKSKLIISAKKKNPYGPITTIQILRSVPGVKLVRRDWRSSQYFWGLMFGLNGAKEGGNIGSDSNGEHRGRKTHSSLPSQNPVLSKLIGYPGIFTSIGTKQGHATTFELFTKGNLKNKEMRERLRANFFNREDVRGKYFGWRLEGAGRRFKLILYRY